MIKKNYLISGLITLVACLGFMTLTKADTVTGTLTTGMENGIGSMNGVVITDPTILPAANTYHATQSVTLTASGSTAICYTTNGTTPVCSGSTTCSTGTVYPGSAISVTSSTTVKGVSCYSNGSSSPVATNIYSLTCNTVANAATYNAYPTCGPATCNSGYTLSGGSCVAQSTGGGGGGGGGGSITTYCTSVTYDVWQTTCYGDKQFRNALAQTPSGCTLTSAQQAEQQRACPVVAPTTPATDTETPPASGSNVLENIATEAEIISSNNTDSLLTHLGGSANESGEQAGLTKYKAILGLDKAISTPEKLTINDFIVYGTNGTQRLGGGERAAVINSYFQAYGKLPNSEAEWSDVLKIASGRWPIERNAAAEARAKVEFKKVYLRNAVMTNNIDENAIMVIAYGLLPLQRNLNSEKVAIKTFKYVYGHDPINALAWNLVRAIAYSGAKR